MRKMERDETECADPVRTSVARRALNVVAGNVIGFVWVAGLALAARIYGGRLAGTVASR